MLLVVRVFPRVLLVLALTLASAGILLVTRPLRLVAPAWQLALRNAAFRAWARGFARVVGMRVEVEGEPPTGPFFLVANHLGYMDIILLATQLDAAFVAKADLRQWPGAGAIIAIADTIFINRGQRRDVVRVMKLVEDALALRLGVVVFPEGTSGPGDGVLPFKTPLLDFAARRDLPVHHATISYMTRHGQPPARDSVCWWGDAPFLPHLVELLRMPGFDARLVFGPEPLHDPDRKALADKLRTAIAERLPTSG